MLAPRNPCPCAAWRQNRHSKPAGANGKNNSMGVLSPRLMMAAALRGASNRGRRLLRVFGFISTIQRPAVKFTGPDAGIGDCRFRLGRRPVGEGLGIRLSAGSSCRAGGTSDLSSDERRMTLTLRISPTGHLFVEEHEGQRSELVDAACARRIVKAFRTSAAAGLLHLATAELESRLPPDLAFAREFAGGYLTKLCQTPGLQASAAAGPIAPDNHQLAGLRRPLPPARRRISERRGARGLVDRARPMGAE